MTINNMCPIKKRHFQDWYLQIIGIIWDHTFLLEQNVILQNARPTRKLKLVYF